MKQLINYILLKIFIKNDWVNYTILKKRTTHSLEKNIFEVISDKKKNNYLIHRKNVIISAIRD